MDLSADARGLHDQVAGLRRMAHPGAVLEAVGEEGRGRFVPREVGLSDGRFGHERAGLGYRYDNFFFHRRDGRHGRGGALRERALLPGAVLLDPVDRHGPSRQFRQRGRRGPEDHARYRSVGALGG